MFRKNIFKKLQEYVLPHVCILCQAICQNKDLCIACTNELPYCKTDYALDNTIALFEYKSPIDQLITGLKFHEKLVYGRVLGELMAESLAIYYQNHPLPASIIPVPLHKKRLQERGYNQAIELGRPIAKKLNLPLLINICERTRATEPQSSLSRTKRQQNVKSAFSLNLKKKVTGRHIAILDDVITTGSTIKAMSQLFKQPGSQVEKITFWCIARTGLQS